MPKKTIHIKNMVCPRCIRVVKEELEKLSLEVDEISLGKVEFKKDIDKSTLVLISRMLKDSGFELLEDKNSKLIETIKTTIIELIQGDSLEDKKIKLSSYFKKKIGYDYNYLSSIFSSIESITIEKYFILQRIERVKELIVYNELSLSEIAFKLGFSSVQHLSGQFKKVTGLTPVHFKELKIEKRIPIDRIKGRS